MVEKKLVEVIDSMTSLVEADHAKIRTLEEEVQQLQNAAVPVPPVNSEDRGSGVQEHYAPAPPTFQERYTRALAEFNNNDIEGALTEFQSLEEEDANGSYAGHYKYWEGECYYAEKHYKDALKAFGTVLDQYPNSVKAAAAEFKTGECYEKMKLTASARAAYEQLIVDYPNSEYRPRAEARLKALKSTKDL